METEPLIVEQYVRTGKAHLVYRHLLQLGAGSLALAEASECAGAQGKFWEMRELIYREQNRLFGATGAAAIQPLAAAIGLDEAEWGQCMDEHRFEQQSKDDHEAARREGVTSRPVMDIDCTHIIGAQGFAAFQKVLDGKR